MWDGATICERLGDLGELRLYLRPGPPQHLAVEVLREEDGRAWTLRVPWPRRGVLRQLLGDSVWKLTSGGRPAVLPGGHAVLARGALVTGDEVVATLLEEGEEIAFALWRRELSRRGEWVWTLDVVVVPEALAIELCRQVMTGLERLEREAGTMRPRAQSGQT
jgi:hypothetical protein